MEKESEPTSSLLHTKFAPIHRAISSEEELRLSELYNKGYKDHIKKQERQQHSKGRSPTPSKATCSGEAYGSELPALGHRSEAMV